MPRHSKNNTALGFFTYAERRMTNYGTKKQRLGTEGKRAFDACYLCQRRARDPLCCPDGGHLACKECFYEHILTQKQEIARQQRRYDAQVEAKARVERDQAAKAEAQRLAEFEQAETRVLHYRSRSNPPTATTTTTSALPTLSSVKRIRETEEVESPKPSTLKERLAAAKQRGQNQQQVVSTHHPKDQGSSTRTTTTMTTTASSKPSPKQLPSFWLPSLTPETSEGPLVSPVNLHPMCTATDTPHRISLKKLVPVHFTRPKTSASTTVMNTIEPGSHQPPTTELDSPGLDQSGSDGAICPACLKSIHNGTRLALVQRCGHVFCEPCMDQFVRKSGTCFVCTQKCSDAKDIIELHYEGTGYVGSGGVVEATRYDVSLG
ncbi:hypothetical protein H4R33_002590 [Dimargaris cristalligena]|uniref:RING-type domain-containing protein n=1 Tax=Dimargaris cristalligena TaxID=215637 RepID=A0A4P9ZRY4_9FUNG|nr:hypothetical protein H4R33_002590 [Dimargaris cristalligena]RKP36145.1 hypothetical protein BJ085DRAFT_36888 [Dimargaris cristalligena]|eukprot:RKP36145.1 hypothetical protein BJ085DRAFT_36888 [Dimargaris cristalligena]